MDRRLNMINYEGGGDVRNVIVHPYGGYYA